VEDQVVQRELARTVRDLPTTAAKIRALAAKGHPRAEIARALGVRYQQVRNVLVRQEAKANLESVQLSNPDGLTGKVRIAADGTTTIPAVVTEALGLKPGDTLFVRSDENEIRLLTRTAVARRIQSLVREYVPEGVSLVDELLEDRRREFEAEAHK
jgi:bifunctional DNA-binding transcriptional regulator/antitoxin component of YhaV-PrlF toxin-antitoxin module